MVTGYGMECIITCEHATNHIPQRFSHLFRGREAVLSSHQAYDPGAADLAVELAKNLEVSVHLGTISRLLIDLNRSRSNRKSLYTSYSRKLTSNERELLLQKYYHPYREKVADEVAGLIAGNEPVLHVSVHTFVPVKNGRVRRAEIGLLYDPARHSEKDIGKFLAAWLQGKMESLQVRRNYPYLGKTDGFTAYLRKIHPTTRYAGIELEVNQALIDGDIEKYRQMTGALLEGIRHIVTQEDFSESANLNTREKC
jgi:predicted N-formylglutamate amidohydrolase